MKDWDPQLYLKFEKQRTQPVKDLISRITFSPERIIDIGCGPGNSTLELKKRWPSSGIIGLDSSEAMIKKAKLADSSVQWVTADASGSLEQLGSFDLVFSNAALQWMPEHKTLLKSFSAMLRPGGMMAMQIPMFEQMPAHTAMSKLAQSEKWGGYFIAFESGMHYYGSGYYYDVLSALGETELWQTDYFHIMPDYSAIIEMLSSTGLRPYLDRLPEEKSAEFIEDYYKELTGFYSRQQDGRVLFPFQRLFFIMRRA